MFYGATAELVKTNHITGTGNSATHEISITGATAGQVTWVQAFSVSGSDTAFSGIVPFTTISNSTGDIKVYFNTPVDNSYSSGTNALSISTAIDDTLIDYINRAKYSVDLTMYNFNNQGISNVSNALIAAANRGLTVRVIGCGTTANLGIDELMGTSVHVLVGPSIDERAGIMHNKFILFDTESTNPNEPIVWTGSTNLTDGQINLDANQVIIIQDQSLARGYKIEFEEMWGSSGSNPDAVKARFGSKKQNNTPHEYEINGIRVESYFSPSDGVNSRIVQNINTTNNDLSIATMLITRTEMADAIAARKLAGAAVNVITNAEGNNNATVNTTLSDALGTHYTFDDVSNGILHHKYMIVDQDAPASDPLVFTGSHNWSAAADNENDENTIIVHDATIANIYYQNFVARFVENNGVLFELTGPPTAVNDSINTGVDQTVTAFVLENDLKQAPVTVSIETAAKNGNSYIPFSNPNVINYLPNTSFIGDDSITYKIAYQASPNLFATAKIYINVSVNGVVEFSGNNRLQVFPNPATSGQLTILCFMNSASNGLLQLLDVTGKVVFEQSVTLTAGENMINNTFSEQLQGMYILRLTAPTAVWNQKVLFE
ncbi:MAG: phospholipase D-like domain-containing protein [Salinivirgaceae bacterium]